jgi:hypothetical protein
VRSDRTLAYLLGVGDAAGDVVGDVVGLGLEPVPVPPPVPPVPVPPPVPPPPPPELSPQAPNIKVLMPSTRAKLITFLFIHSFFPDGGKRDFPLLNRDSVFVAYLTPFDLPSSILSLSVPRSCVP